MNIVRTEQLYYTKRVEISTSHTLDAEGVRLCVTGGRTYDNVAVVNQSLQKIHDEEYIREIGVGCALGLDAAVFEWAVANNISYRLYRADWDRYGLQAGIYRNESMLTDFKPDRLLVYPGNTGTTDCARRARKLGIERSFIDVGTDPFAEAEKWG